MIRLLTTRRWLGMIALAIGFAVVCAFLGRWQWSRHVERSAAAGLVSRHYSGSPVPLDAVLPASAEQLPSDAEWRRVIVTGRYDMRTHVFVRNRPQSLVYGYELVVPLQLADGSALLVDRGWVPNAERADVLPQVAAPPEGQITVQGWLRPGEPSLERQLPEGQLASIELTEAAADTGTTLRPAYLVLEEERTADGRVPERPTPLLPPDTGTGPHLAYALQWWLVSPVGFLLIFVYVRRELRESQVSAGSLGSGAPRPVARAKKVRIWDEEDE